MLVCEILRIKGNTLFAASPETSVAEAVHSMASLDIGSLVVMEKGKDRKSTRLNSSHG